MVKSAFTARIANCTMSIALDLRHPKGEMFPVCLRYCISSKRIYHPIGDYSSPEDFTAIMNTEATRGRVSETKKSYAIQKKKWEADFESYRERLESLASSSVLTLEIIRISLTGKSASFCFLSVWEEIINGRKAGTAASYEGALKSFVKETGFNMITVLQ